MAKEASPKTGWGRWVAPDLAMVAAIASVVYCIFLFHAEWSLFNDSDSGWHIRTGDWILKHRAVPARDMFSFVETGRPWYAWEWGADVLMSVAHSLGGLTGVAALYVAAIAFTAWLWFRLNRAMGSNVLLTVLVAAPLVASTQVHWLARPHVISWIFLLAFLFLIERGGEKFTWRDGVLFGGLTIVWAAVHASFILAGAIAGLYALGQWLMGQRVRAWWSFQAAVVIGLATFMNPYGWNLHLHILEFFRHPEWRADISEWRPADFSIPALRLVRVVVLIVALGAILRFLQRRWDQALVMTVVTLSAILAARGIPMMALVCLPMATSAITDWLRRVRAARGLFELTGELDTLDGEHGGLALAPVLLIALVIWARLPSTVEGGGFRAGMYPVGADAIVGSLKEPRILASDLWGGYLIYRFNGSPKVFVDARADYYTKAPLEQFYRIVRHEASWRKDLEELKATHLLIDTRWPITPVVEAEGWRTLWSEGTFVLLERPGASKL